MAMAKAMAMATAMAMAHIIQYTEGGVFDARAYIGLLNHSKSRDVFF